MQALFGVLQPLFRKIGDIFDLFDLSFLVAGGSSVLAILYVAWMLGLQQHVPTTGGGVAWFFFVLIMVTVWGLISFAVGPLFKRVFYWLPLLRRAPWDGTSFDAYLRDAIAGHGLADDPLVKQYLDRGTPVFRLYVRMWAEVRQADEVGDSFELLRRFWVLTASFDALATSGMFWAAAFILGAVRPELSPITQDVSIAAAVISVLLGLSAAHEASRSRSNQVEELAATYAHLVATRAQSVV